MDSGEMISSEFDTQSDPADDNLDVTVTVLELAAAHATGLAAALDMLRAILRPEHIVDDAVES